DLSAHILRMLLSAASIQHGPRQVHGRFGRLSVVLRWEDSRAKSQAARSSRPWSQIVRSNFGESLPANDEMLMHGLDSKDIRTRFRTYGFSVLMRVASVRSTCSPRARSC